MEEIILRSQQRWFDLASQIDLLEVVFSVLKFVMWRIFMLLLFGIMLLKY